MMGKGLRKQLIEHGPGLAHRGGEVFCGKQLEGLVNCYYHSAA